MRTLAIALIVLTACSAEKPQPPAAPAKPAPPSIAEAQALIAESPDFGDYEFTNASYSLPMQGSQMNEPARDAVARLRRAGWISVDGAGNVTLSSKAKSDKRFLVRSNGFLDIVPLAKKEMVGVIAVRPDPEGAAVDFDWKWIPNEIGSAFRSEYYAVPQKATATLIHDGKSWMILRIRRRE